MGAKRDQSSSEAATEGLLFVTSHEGAEQFAGFTAWNIIWAPNWRIAFSAERTKSYQSMFFLALVQGASDSLKTKNLNKLLHCY